MQAKSFLDHYFTGCDGAVHLWVLRSDGKSRSYWCEPDDCPTDVDQDNAVYFGTCTRVESLGPYRRGKKSEILSAPSLWVEIDFLESAEQKNADKNYPPADQAIKCLESLVVPPSCVVHSGGGLHCYWLLVDPFHIHTDADRRYIQNIIRLWQGVVERQLGYDIDHVHDITRLLRVPGSINHKYDGQIVALLPQYRSPETWIRYRIAKHIIPHLPDELELEAGKNCGGKSPRTQAKAEAAAEISLNDDGLVLSLDRSPPAGKLDTLLENCLEFKTVWRRRAKHIKSQSECDFAIAMHTVEAGWPDQVVLDAIICHRVKHKHKPEKSLRADYMRGTLAKAKQLVQAEQEVSMGIADSDTCRELIREKLGIDIESIVRHGEDKPSFVVTIADKGVISLTETQLFSACSFRRRIMARLLQNVKTVKPKDWTKITAAMLSLITVAEHTATEDVQHTFAIVRDYWGMFGGDDRDVAALEDKPFIHGDHLHISAPHLTAHLSEPLNVTRERLRSAGFVTQQVRFTVDGVKHWPCYYRIPLEHVPVTLARL